MTETPTYRSWCSMKTRCSNPNVESYADYGARGIKVCARWQSFDNFLADMGVRPDGTTLDRIDNDGNYEPGNCRWASGFEQHTNRRSTLLTAEDAAVIAARLDGGARTKALADEYGVATAVISRIKYGQTWSEVTGRACGASGRRKLDASDLAAARSALAAGEATSSVAARFGMSVSHARSLRNGRR